MVAVSFLGVFTFIQLDGDWALSDVVAKQQSRSIFAHNK